MKPFATTLLMGIAFSSGMLVPLIGLHATEDFKRLEPLGALIWGEQPIVMDQVATAGETLRSTDMRSVAADHSAAREDTSPAPNQPAAVELAAAPPIVAERPAIVDTAPLAPRAERDELATAPSASTPDDPTQRESLSKGDVAEIQTLLLIRGFSPGPIDGVMGAQTKQAIRAFERSLQLPETGEATPALHALLTGTGGSRTVARHEVAPAKQEPPVQSAAVTTDAGGDTPVRLIP